jgi:hypothetical protein
VRGVVNTHTVTGVERRFADPFKVCLDCGAWVTGVVDIPGEPLILMPCEHQAVYKDLCPSWGPVDGCKCPPGEHAKP